MINKPFELRNSALLTLLIYFFTTTISTSCSEDEVESNSSNLSDGKPIEISIGSTTQTYLDIKAHYYAPSVEGNASLIFAIPPSQDFALDMLNALKPIANERGSIIVSVVTESNTIQYGKLLDSLISSDYVDRSKVFVAGFSDGGTTAFEMGKDNNAKIKGLFLIASGSTLRSVDSEKMPALCFCSGTADDVSYISNVSESKSFAAAGIKTKLVEVQGYNHADMIYKEYRKEKIECFDFLIE